MEAEGNASWQSTHRTQGRERVSQAHHRLRLLASPMRTSAARVRSLLVDRETSRFPYKERPHMPSSPTTPGRASTSVVVPVRVAFRNAKSVGARDEVIFAAQ